MINKRFGLAIFSNLSLFCILSLLTTGICYSQYAFEENPTRATDVRTSHQMLGFSFIIPQGWICQQNETGAVLGHNSIGGVIILAAHNHSSMEAMKKEMLLGVSEADITLTPTGTFSPRGYKCISLSSQGFAEGRPVKGKSFGKLMKPQGGAYVTSLAIPSIYGSQLEGAANKIANSVKGETKAASVIASTTAPTMLQTFSGTWVAVSKHSKTSYRLFRNGTFSSDSESSYGGDFSNGYQNTGSWGTTNQSSGQGKWSVTGNVTSGILTLQPAGEAPYRVKYHMHIEKGERFPREYLFDGELFQVTY